MYKKQSLSYKYSLTLLTISLMSIGIVHAQIDQFPIPVAPNTTAFAKLIDFPASNSTGIIPVTIPLYEIKLKDFTLPISLNYTTKGIHTEEIASSVGLGWSLNAGGSITRAVRGVPDDYNKDKLSILDEAFPEVGRFWTGKAYSIISLNDQSNDYSYIDDAIQNIVLLDGYGGYSNHGRNDTEADLFYMNLPTISGKFAIDVITLKTHFVCLMPYQDIIVSYDYDTKGNINSFTLKDLEGNTYLLQDKERIMIDSEYYDGLNITMHGDIEELSYNHNRREYNSAWYITRIITLNKDTVDFSYISEKYSQTESKLIFKNPSNSSLNGYADNQTVYTNIVINKITTKNEEIIFSQNNYRKDIPKAKSIDKITIKSKLSGETIKLYDLIYSYYQSQKGSTESVSISNGAISNEYRLKLDVIKDAGVGNYEFSYISERNLPVRNTCAQDAWGYYNDKKTNKSLIPTMYYYPTLSGSEQYSFLDLGNNITKEKIDCDANRNANAGTVTVGMLSRIKYPASGYTDYEYESNKFMYKNVIFEGGGVRIKTIKKFDGISSKPTLQQNYEYSTGKIISLPIFASFRSFLLSTKRTYLIHNQSQVELGKVQGGFVCYDQVTIKNGGNNGKTIFNYSNPGTYGITKDFSGDQFYELPQTKFVSYNNFSMDSNRTGYNVSPFPPNPEYDWKRGLLISEISYDQTGVPVKENTYEYQNYYPSERGIPYPIYNLKYSIVVSGRSFYDTSPVAIFFSKYKLQTQAAILLKKKTEKIYTKNNSPLTSETIYEYDSPVHMRQTILHKTNSNGLCVSERYNYVWDYYWEYEDGYPDIIIEPTGKLPNVPATHCLYKEYANKLIEKISYFKKDGKYYVTNAVLNTYIYSNDKPVLYGTYEMNHFEQSRAITGFSSTNRAGTFYMNDSYKKIHSFDLYGNDGNLLQYTSIAGVSTVYLWSYKNQYPIAEIKNTTYNQVKDLISESTLNALSAKIAPTSADWSMINNLTVSLKNALITTYTYRPLVGMMTSTSPQGLTTYYAYDAGKRLKEVYIFENGVKRILKSYIYNYKNP